MALTLPLVTFERYMLAEDTPEYPRAFILEVTLSGNLRARSLRGGVARCAGPTSAARSPDSTRVSRTGFGRKAMRCPRQLIGPKRTSR